MSQMELAGRGGGEPLPPLLEREHELQALDQALDRLEDGAGSLLLIEGPAGIGKTRLLAEAISLAGSRQLLVRSARGGEIEREIPFGVVRQLLEPVVQRASEEERVRLLSGSARLALPAFGWEGPAETEVATEAFGPIHGLYWLLANLSDSQPVVLAIDDVQWADPQTLRFLEYLSRHLTDLPVVLIAGVRTGEPDEPRHLDPLRLEAQRVHPGPLSTAAVGELVTPELGAEPSAEFVEACTAATGGNPFLLREVLHGLRADAMAPDAAAAKALAELAPETVARYSLVRLGRFGDEAVAVTRAIAVLGGAPQLRHVGMLAGVEEATARTLCDRLREAEILTPGLPIDFVHPLVRQAIYRDLSEGERSAMHRRAAEILRATGTGVREIAPHLLACSPNGDQWVVTRLRDAAAEATAAGAHDAAVTYLDRALKEPPDERVGILYELGRALIESEPLRAQQILEELADDVSEPAWRLKVLRSLAFASLLVGRIADAARATAELLESVPDNDREQRVALEAQVYFLTTVSRGRDAASSERIGAQARGLTGATAAECLARQALAVDRFSACAPVDEVVALALPFPPLPWTIAGTRTSVPFAAAKVLSWSGRWDLAREALLAYMEEAHRGGRPLALSGGNSFLSEVDRLGGRLAEAEAEARTAWTIADVLAGLLLGWSAIMNLAATLIARGDITGARELTQGFDLSAGVREVPVNPWPIELRGYLRLAEGDLEGGVHDLLTLGEELEERGALNPAVPPWRQEAAPALVSLGRAAEAKKIIAVAEDRARAFGAPHVIGTVLRARASLEPRKRQIGTLRKSVSALGVYGPPHELARSLIELGAALRRDGQRSEARARLQHALELAHRSGAGGVAERARDELAAVGSRPRRPVRTGIAALTPSELRTARLAAEGLQNREIAQRLFVTLRTVETHLTHAYEKLQVSGRSGLKAALADPAVGG